jgi:hypothetical protein
MGPGGCRALTNEWANNPNASAEVLRTQLGTCGQQYCFDINRSVYVDRSGYYRTIAQVGAELNRRMGVNAPVIPHIATVSSPLSTITNPNAAYTYTGSPYGGVNPFYGAFAPSGGTSYATGGTQQSSPYSFVTSMFSSLLNPNQQPTTQSGPPALQPAAVSIVAQPNVAYVGSPIIVSWSSVGTRSGSCRIEQHDSFTTTNLGATHEGSKIVQANAKGVMRFAITCQNFSGSPVQQVVSVTVQ